MKLTRRNIIVFLMAIGLIVLVQLVRLDLFLDIRKIENNPTFEYRPKAESLLSTAEKEQFSKKKSLILAGNAAQAELGNVRSVLELLQFQVEQLDLSWPVPGLADFDLLILFDDAALDQADLATVFSYVRSGGNLLLLGNGSSGGDSVLQNNPALLGLDRLGPPQASGGVDFQVELLAGLEGPCSFLADSQEHSSLLTPGQAVLRENSQVLATDLADNPLIWQLKDRGRIMVINNGSFASKRLRGLVTGAISFLMETIAYPVARTAVYQIIDLDWTNSGVDAYINQFYKRSFSQYLQHVWWPDMAGLMNRHDLRYTVAYLGYKGHSPPGSEAGSNEAFASLSRLVLRGQGEISFQGLPSGFGWSGQSLEPEISDSAAFLRQVLPNYQVRAYVKAEDGPTDDLISAVGKKLPDIRIISGSYLADARPGQAPELHELAAAADGTVYFPRVTYSKTADGCLKFDLASVITTHGLVSHAIRADEIAGQPQAEPDWASLHRNYGELFSYIGQSYPWLENDTISTGAAKLEQASNLDVYYEASNGQIRLAAGNGAANPTLLLVTSQTVTGGSGCTWEKVDSVRYLVTMQAKTAVLEVE